MHWPCPKQSGLTVGLFYFEIERLSLHKLICALHFNIFVYVYDVLCTRGNFPHLGDMIGRCLAWLASMLSFDM